MRALTTILEEMNLVTEKEESQTEETESYSEQILHELANNQRPVAYGILAMRMKPYIAGNKVSEEELARVIGILEEQGIVSSKPWVFTNEKGEIVKNQGNNFMIKQAQTNQMFRTYELTLKGREHYKRLNDN